MPRRKAQTATTAATTTTATSTATTTDTATAAAKPNAEPSKRATRKRSSPGDGPEPGREEEVRTVPKRRRGEKPSASVRNGPLHGISGDERNGEGGVEVEDEDEDEERHGNDGGDTRALGGAPVEPELELGPDTAIATTPSKRRGRKPKSETMGTLEGGNNKTATPSSSRLKTAVETPVAKRIDTPSRRKIADRSARRKSARALIDRVVGDEVSDDEDVDRDIAREIYESSASDDEEQEENERQEEGTGGDASQGEDPSAGVTTPSKRPRGRPKKAVTRQRSPTPPRDLPAHEQYFFQNKPGLAKTSSNNLSSLDLLTHEEYFTLLNKHKDPHAEDIKYLESLHAESFSQWAFELSQGFSICAYGYGSKKRLLHQFATYLYKRAQEHGRNSSTSNSSKIVIVNGYVRSTSARDILGTVASAIDPSCKLPAGNPAAAVQGLLTLLSSSPKEQKQQQHQQQQPLILIINSIDAPPMRKSTIQAALARLAAHPRIQLACSADAPDFPLLWDGGLRSSFAFAFHDATTFRSPSAAEADVVDEVRELLGRRARRAGGREGVAFVLRSLPENARALFRLLVGEVLVAAEDGNGGGGGGYYGGAGEDEGPAVEYRMLYNKAVEEFICSSEMAFRTLLKEFHDHQMITSHKDAIGTELLSLPFRKDELEAILEDLVS